MLNKSLWVVEDQRVQETLMKYTKDVRRIPQGSFIYRQDDVREYLYFLTEGRIKVSIFAPNGYEKTLAIHEPGSFFGETAFFDEHPSFSCAMALKNCTVLIFGKEQIFQLMREQPIIISHIFESMSRKIRLLSFQVEYLSFMKIEERLVALLTTLFASFGSACCDAVPSGCSLSSACTHGYVLEQTLTDQEIGDMLGVRREAVTKAMNHLKKQALIYKQKRTICCPDLPKLNNFLSNKN